MERWSTRARSTGTVRFGLLGAVAMVAIACGGATTDGGSTYAVELDDTITAAGEQLVDWAQADDRDPADLEPIAAEVREAAESGVPEQEALDAEARPLFAEAQDAAVAFADELERVAAVDALELSDLVALDGSLTNAEATVSAFREVVEREADG